MYFKEARCIFMKTQSEDSMTAAEYITRVPLLPVMTGTLRGRDRQSKMIGFCTQGMRKWVPSPTTESWTPLNRSNITARCPASTVDSRTGKSHCFLQLSTHFTENLPTPPPQKNLDCFKPGLLLGLLHTHKKKKQYLICKQNVANIKKTKQILDETGL